MVSVLPLANWLKVAGAVLVDVNPFAKLTVMGVPNVIPLGAVVLTDAV